MSTFGITFQGRLKHAKLLEAAKKLGGQSALARYLGLSPVMVGRWCNLQACPPTCEEEIHHKSCWTTKRLEELEVKLLDLTGSLLNDLFPVELRLNKRFLDSPKTSERTQQVELRHLASLFRKRLTLPDPAEEVEEDERKRLLCQTLATAFKQLPYRGAEILKMRFGLGELPPSTLTECAKVFKITKERVRQIEIRSLRILEHSDECAPLEEGLV